MRSGSFDELLKSGAVTLGDVGIVPDDIELIGCGDLGESTQRVQVRNYGLAGEAILDARSQLPYR